MNGLDVRLVTLHENRVRFKEKIEKVEETVAQERAKIREELRQQKKNR